MPPFEPRVVNMRRVIGWLNLGRNTQRYSTDESRQKNARKRHRAAVRAATRRRRAHGRQRR